MTWSTTWMSFVRVAWKRTPASFRVSKGTAKHPVVSIPDETTFLMFYLGDFFCAWGPKPLTEPMLTRDYCHPSECNFTENKLDMLAKNYHWNLNFQRFFYVSAIHLIVSCYVFSWGERFGTTCPSHASVYWTHRTRPRSERWSYWGLLWSHRVRK